MGPWAHALCLHFSRTAYLALRPLQSATLYKFLITSPLGSTHVLPVGFFSFLVLCIVRCASAPGSGCILAWAARWLSRMHAMSDEWCPTSLCGRPSVFLLLGRKFLFSGSPPSLSSMIALRQMVPNPFRQKTLMTLYVSYIVWLER